jgi:hypothetical protein
MSDRSEKMQAIRDPNVARVRAASHGADRSVHARLAVAVRCAPVSPEAGRKAGASMRLANRYATSTIDAPADPVLMRWRTPACYAVTSIPVSICRGVLTTREVSSRRIAHHR